MNDVTAPTLPADPRQSEAPQDEGEPVDEFSQRAPSTVPHVLTDLFISYAWTSAGHRDWVRLLAAHLKVLGYNVLIDANVDYGDSLSGFMRRVIETRHVLLVVDENYVGRADSVPSSGVAKENRWMEDVFDEKPPTWLSVLFKDNPTSKLPSWLVPHDPKGFWFNTDHATGSFPGSEQVEELWRWFEDLPADRQHAIPAVLLRERAARLERIEVQRDPGRWRSPTLEGRVHFEYSQTTSSTYRVGHGEFEFAIQISDRGNGKVAVYADPVKAVGLLRSSGSSLRDLERSLGPGRVVDASAGDVVTLLNEHGALCRLEITAVQEEFTGAQYIPASVDFRYKVILDS